VGEGGPKPESTHKRPGWGPGKEQKSDDKPGNGRSKNFKIIKFKKGGKKTGKQTRGKGGNVNSKR